MSQRMVEAHLVTQGALSQGRPETASVEGRLQSLSLPSVPGAQGRAPTQSPRRLPPRSATTKPTAPKVAEHYAISYFSTSDFREAQNFLQEIGNVLGNGDGDKLQLVRTRGGKFTIVRNGDDSLQTVTELAAKHSEKLRELQLEPLQTISAKSFQKLYAISFGSYKDLPTARGVFGEALKIIGNSAQTRLVIEKNSDGTFEILYRSFTSAADTMPLLRDFTRRFKNTGILLSSTSDHGAVIAFDYSSYAGLDRVIRYSPLNETKPLPNADSRLQEQAERTIVDLRKRGRLGQREKVGLVVTDLNSGEKLVSINEDSSLQSASMIKTFVALAYYHEVQHNRIIDTPRRRELLQRMIQASSNSATNDVMALIGGPKVIQERLKANFPALVRDTSIVENIPDGGRSYLNRASAGDFTRLLTALWKNELPHSGDIKRLMGLPGGDRIRDYAKDIPLEAVILNKTGSTAMLCGDMGIVVFPDQSNNLIAYTFVGIIESPRKAANYPQWLGARARGLGTLSQVAFEDFKKRYQLAN